MNVQERYQNDVRFHALVDNFRSIFRCEKYTGDDLRSAIGLAEVMEGKTSISEFLRKFSNDRRQHEHPEIYFNPEEFERLLGFIEVAIGVEKELPNARLYPGLHFRTVVRPRLKSWFSASPEDIPTTSVYTTRDFTKATMHFFNAKFAGWKELGVGGDAPNF